jgi:gluconolactonase
MKKELSISGVFRVRDGNVALVTDELKGPNGLAFSPDERVLYVGDWDPQHKAVMRYDVAADGSTSNGRLLVELTDEVGDDSIDGIKVGRDGTLYICGPGGVWVVAPDGQTLGCLQLPEAPHNLAWGDTDGNTLYITAMTSIYRLRLPPTTQHERTIHHASRHHSRRHLPRLRTARRERCDAPPLRVAR